jgi:adenylosuccinate lyase
VLLGLAGKHLLREEAYRIVQDNVMKSWVNCQDFAVLIKNDERVITVLPQDEIDRLFDGSHLLKQQKFLEMCYSIAAKAVVI